VDPRTGEVLALVGGRSYNQSQYNRAIIARRQPGSVFKPFVYLAAFERAAEEGTREVTPAMMVNDEETTWTFDDQVWTPANYENQYDGQITLRQALAHSRNIATIKVAEVTGYDRVASLWKSIGIGTVPKAYPSIALGVFEATPFEIATAYTLFPNQGQIRPLRSILRIVNGDKVQAWVDSAPETPASVLLVIGLVLVAGGAFIFTRKNKHDVDEMPKWLQAVEAVPPYLAFAWGAVDMAAPGIQYAYFLGGVAVIAAAGLEPAGEIVSLILFILLLQVMMVSPIVLYVAFRGHADRVLGRVKGWLGAHGNQLGGGILILVGLPMLLKGLGISG
jgi:LPXTG-motif cell wall-anchored protein